MKKKEIKEKYDFFDDTDNNNNNLYSNIDKENSINEGKRNFSEINHNRNFIDFDNLESLDEKVNKIMNNNKKEELKNIKDNKEKNINNTFVICYTESINTLEDKSSTSKEKDNIIILDKSIKKIELKLKKIKIIH